MREQPLPPAWQTIVRRNVAASAGWSEAERRAIAGYAHVFVAEKNWEGCQGLAIDDEIRVTIAAQVGRLVLGFESPEYFEHVLSILVYPFTFVAAEEEAVGETGLVLHGHGARDGEAWYRGPVILAWPEVLAESRGRTGRNVVLHEFAHQLDMQNGQEVDGIPPQPTGAAYRRWEEVLGGEYERVVEDCDAGRRTLLDAYAATDPGEFFAVATETFLERPRPLAARHPELYALLRDYYRQDPASRPEPPA